MGIKTIGVVGAGTMGNGIAQVASMAGFDVVMSDIDDKFVQNGLKSIDKFLAKSVEKGKMSADDKSAIMGRIKGTTNMADMKDCDLVVEVVVEVMDVKKKVFKQLDEITKKDAILATNTSSMSVTEIANATARPEKVVGMHFFNPVPLMKLVEVIRGMKTNDETITTVMELAKKLGKEPVEVKVDVPGFLANRLMIAVAIEAIKLYEQGIASKEDVDKAAKLGLNYPMGPFELMDLTGVDINYHVMDYFYKELPKELKWNPPLTIKNMVKAGLLGRKTGAGWYDYNK
jgi:3-hydroxybutyryl-CoA dehydrogenase